ncbi:MAG: 5-formyltetrahydrofolate cyclo-ligase [Cryomorphaceae bacterium]|nr:MAG: 5-formyltetrahydrofolate cyclo-ligase [Cryomorphaceae bacterium]
MDITAEKKELRTEMLERRARINPDVKRTYDAWICEELYQHIEKENYRTVHAYIPLPAEINITPLLEKLLAEDVCVVCPRALPARKLENRVLHSLDELEIGKMGTRHPAEADIYEGPVDFVIVPGLAFDRSRYRLGYGGGYYDNFLIAQSKAQKTGIFYPFQEVEKVPREAHDVQLDEVLFKEF